MAEDVHGVHDEESSTESFKNTPSTDGKPDDEKAPLGVTALPADNEGNCTNVEAAEAKDEIARADPNYLSVGNDSHPIGITIEAKEPSDEESYVTIYYGRGGGRLLRGGGSRGDGRNRGGRRQITNLPRDTPCPIIPGESYGRRAGGATDGRFVGTFADHGHPCE